MRIDTNIQSRLTPSEKEVFTIIREVIDKHTPSTKAYAVGGWTRDKLLGVDSNDIDIMLDNISGADFAKLVTQHLNIKDPNVIKANPEKSKHITTAKAYIPLSNGEVQEIDFAQARAEVYEEDSRIPTLKPATPKEDAHRRDLTINSIFYSINNNEIVDFTGKGIKDLVSDTFRTPEEPLKTFSDDPLRIFRVIRFAAKYGGNIDEETYKAMMDPSLRDQIKQKISKERMGAEITKMLKNPNPEIALNLLKETGLWQDILSEALVGTPYEGKMETLDMEQNNPHHTLSVWGHTMQVVKNVLDKYPDTDPEKRATMILAALMHDMGKLYTEIHSESKSHPGRTSYIGHEKESRTITEHILKYLKMEPFIQQVSGMARYHMRPHFNEGSGNAGLKAMRKFIRQMGEKSLNWLDVFNLAVADAYSKGVDIDPETVQTYQNLEVQLQQALASLNPVEDENIKPILNGNEIMQLLNIKPGKWMSEIMEFVKELRDENPDITKEEASQIVKDKYQNIDVNDIREASKKDKDMGSVCPMHLLKNKIQEVNTDFGEKNYYKVLQTLQELKEEYGKDDNILRFLAISMFKLLLEGSEYRNVDLLTYLFGHAEKNFFDTTLCSYVLGILLLINTPTEDEIIEEIAERMIKMSPGTVRRILDSLPEKVARQNLKKEFKKLLCKSSE